MFVFRPKKEEVEVQEREVGVPPVDIAPPVNYPYRLEPSWTLSPVGHNLWKATLVTPLALTGGVDDVPAPAGEFYFWHRELDVEFFQQDAAGDRAEDALTYEWGHRVAGSFAILRARPSAPKNTVRLEGVRFPSGLGGEEYRFRFEGTATNVVHILMWIEVLRP